MKQKYWLYVTDWWGGKIASHCIEAESRREAEDCANNWSLAVESRVGYETGWIVATESEKKEMEAKMREWGKERAKWEANLKGGEER